MIITLYSLLFIFWHNHHKADSTGSKGEKNTQIANKLKHKTYNKNSNNNIKIFKEKIC